MKYLLTPVWGLFALLMVLLASCSEETQVIEYEEIEQLVLDEWIETNSDPAIAALANCRQEQGFYVTELEDSAPTGDPIMDIGQCWVNYNMTAYDLEGNVISSRNEVVIWQQGTYCVRTRYVPIFEFITLDEDDDLDYEVPPFLYYALTQELNIDGAPAYIRVGSKFRVYTPSEYIGDAATIETGFGGYLSFGGVTPMVADIEIVSIVANISSWETFAIEAFASNNGTFDKTVSYNSSTDDDDEDAIEEYNVAKEELVDTWSNALSSVSNLYIKRRYTPSEIFTYSTPYTLTTLPAGASPYEDVDAMNEAIRDVLIDLFGEGEMDGNRILDSEANIWYVARTLDGFVFDTNIEEVMEIIIGEEASSSYTYISYSSDDDADDYITALYYAIPQLRYGQWASFIFTSTYGYEEDGAVAGTVTDGGSTTSLAPYTPLLFEVYIEPQWDVD
ncbi:MAG: hypothetical protein SNH13_04505 [Rikenellaceae bacterium]